MSRKRPNHRIETWNKLCENGLSDKKKISKLELEDLKDIIPDPIFQDILLLRKYIKEGNETKYFNIYSEDNERKEETYGE